MAGTIRADVCKFGGVPYQRQKSPGFFGPFTDRHIDDHPEVGIPVHCRRVAALIFDPPYITRHSSCDRVDSVYIIEEISDARVIQIKQGFRDV